MKLEEERALREQRRLSGEPSRQEKEFRAFARGLLVNCTSQGALLSRLAPDMLVEGSEAEERLIRASFPFLPALSANPNRSAWRSTDGDSFRSQRHGSLHDSACSVSNSSPRVASPTRARAPSPFDEVDPRCLRRVLAVQLVFATDALVREIGTPPASVSKHRLSPEIGSPSNRCRHDHGRLVPAAAVTR